MTSLNLPLAKYATLETSRLTLRPIQLSDAADMFEYASDPKVIEYVSFEQHQTLADTQKAIADHFMVAPLGRFGIIHRQTNKFIGTISLMDLTPHGAEIGYVLNRKFWGQGLAPEAAQALLELDFQHLDLKYIQAYQLTSNPQSARVLEKIGLKCIGTLPNYLPSAAGMLDTNLWMISQAEYTASTPH